MKTTTIIPLSSECTRSWEIFLLNTYLVSWSYQPQPSQDRDCFVLPQAFTLQVLLSMFTPPHILVVLWRASFFKELQVSYPSFKLSSRFCTELFRHLCLHKLSVADLLSGKRSRAVGIPDEVMESLVPNIETMALRSGWKLWSLFCCPLKRDGPLILISEAVAP